MLSESDPDKAVAMLMRESAGRVREDGNLCLAMLLEQVASMLDEHLMWER